MRPLYIPTDQTRIAGLRRDVEMLKRRAQVPAGSSFDGFWLSHFILPITKNIGQTIGGNNMTLAVDTTVPYNMTATHSAVGTDTFCYFAIMPLGPRGWFPHLNVKVGTGQGSIDMYVAGAYDLTASNTSTPAAGSVDWMHFSSLNLAAPGGGPVWTGLSWLSAGPATDSLPGSFAISPSVPVFTKSTTYSTSGPTISDLDGSPGYYWLRVDLTGTVAVNELALFAHNFF